MQITHLHKLSCLITILFMPKHTLLFCDDHSQETTINTLVDQLPKLYAQGYRTVCIELPRQPIAHALEFLETNVRYFANYYLTSSFYYFLCCCRSSPIESLRRYIAYQSASHRSQLIKLITTAQQLGMQIELIDIDKETITQELIANDLNPENEDHRLYYIAGAAGTINSRNFFNRRTQHLANQIAHHANQSNNGVIAFIGNSHHVQSQLRQQGFNSETLVTLHILSVSEVNKFSQLRDDCSHSLGSNPPRYIWDKYNIGFNTSQDYPLGLCLIDEDNFSFEDFLDKLPDLDNWLDYTTDSNAAPHVRR